MRTQSTKSSTIASAIGARSPMTSTCFGYKNLVRCKRCCSSDSSLNETKRHRHLDILWWWRQTHRRPLEEQLLYGGRQAVKTVENGRLVPVFVVGTVLVANNNRSSVRHWLVWCHPRSSCTCRPRCDLPGRRGGRCKAASVGRGSRDQNRATSSHTPDGGPSRNSRHHPSLRRADESDKVEASLV